MGEHAFLSPSRRKVVNGDTDEFAESTVRAYRAETKKQTQMALKELISVAESEHIRNEEVFEIEKVVELVSKLLSDQYGDADQSITPLTEFDGGYREHARAHPYRVPLYSQLRFTIDSYKDRLYGPHPADSSGST